MLYFILGGASVIGAIFLWFLYTQHKEEQEKNPAGGIVSSSLRPSHPTIVKDIEEIYQNILKGMAVIKNEKEKYDSLHDFAWATEELAENVMKNIKNFETISSSIKNGTKYKGRFLLRNDIRFYNENIKKINDAVEEFQSFFGSFL